MQRFLTTILCLSLVGYFSLSNAQMRSCDLQVVVFKPETMDTFISPEGDYDVVVGMINHGPDTLNQTDMYSVRLRVGGVIRNATYHKINRLVPPNDTFIHYDRISSRFRGSVDSAVFCAEVFAWNTTTSPRLIYERGEQAENNTNCIFITHIDNYPVSSRLIKASQTAVYPNPVTRGESVTVSNLKLKSEVHVFDAEGKHLYHSINCNSKLEIDTSYWDSGIYYLQIRTDLESLIMKIVVK
jgi:hypothetical protein